MHVERFAENPIIHPALHASLGNNINGPSLIRVPDWVSNSLGKYYLYFAHHGGLFIRLAYADKLNGPWKIHVPGTLQLKDSTCILHIASPDVHVVEASREIWMYFHGPVEGNKQQRTKLALSTDGLTFQVRPEELGDSYFRVFHWAGFHYALVMPGHFMRSRDGLTHFEMGPTLFTEDMRHSAVMLKDNILYVFYSNSGDCPERILVSRIDINNDWMQWKASPAEAVLQPELQYEGADLTLAPSVRGLARTPVHQLRDPGIFQEDGHTYLLYSVAGEAGIAVARLTF